MRGHGSKQRGFRAKVTGEGKGWVGFRSRGWGHSVRTEESWEMQ